MTVWLPTFLALAAAAVPVASAPEAVRLSPAPAVELDPHSDCGRAPEPRTPIDGRAFIATGPSHLEWRAAEGAAGYRLEISPNPWMTPVVNDARQVFRGTRARLDGLGPGTWFWRVSAVDGEGRSRVAGQSGVRRFGIRAEPREPERR